MLPARRQPQRSGIERAPRREWPRHRKFVRSHECCAADGTGSTCHGSIEFAHVRSAANSGTGIKPPDWFGVSLCQFHHGIQHLAGAETFQKVHGIDLWKLAAEFAKASPDVAMKLAMKEAGL